jgi:hypothetical protein
MRWGWERLAALAGVVAVALWIAAVAVEESTTGAEEDDAEGLLARYQNEADSVLASGFLLQLGALFFLVFLIALRSRQFTGEGGSRPLTGLAFAGGVGVALFALAGPGAEMSAAINEEEITAETALTLSNVGDIFFIGAELSAVPFLAASGLLAVRSRVLPTWWGWLSLVLALWLLILPIGWVALIFGFPLWVLLTSVLLYLRPSTAPASAPAARS